MKQKVIWCLMRDQFGHVKPVEAVMKDQYQFVYDRSWDPQKLIDAKPSLVLCVNDFHFDVVRCLDAAKSHGIPSLVIQDGILEWRCQYENPSFGYGGGAPQHQPVMADKIACIGFQSARQIAAWGNAHKVEVTGMPRLDYLQGRSGTRKSTNTILVMTAKKPGFTPEQTDITLKSLRDLKGYFETRDDIDVVWRITKGLDRELGVENRLKSLDSADLVTVLENVDAVITTPSTAMLEAMLLDLPVALLDYHNTPRFVQTAWAITCQSQIECMVSDILDPLAVKMMHQRDCLQDTLFLGQASQRVADLIVRMISKPLAANMMELHPFDPSQSYASIQLSNMYPDNPAFRQNDLDDLRIRHARLAKDYERLKIELSRRQWSFYVNRLIAKVLRFHRGRDKGRRA